jgi:hypothetical protein
MMLLPLSSGRVSLEFAPSELGAVLAALARGETVHRKRLATHEDVVARGERFVLYDEWEEPCLISMTEAGDAILRSIADSGAARAKVA